MNRSFWGTEGLDYYKKNLKRTYLKHDKWSKLLNVRICGIWSI